MKRTKLKKKTDREGTVGWLMEVLSRYPRNAIAAGYTRYGAVLRFTAVKPISWKDGRTTEVKIFPQTDLD